MKVGDLEMELVDTYFYCRHCSDNTPFPRCQRRGHRSGIFFLVKASVPEKSTYFVIGEGECEGELPWNVEYGPIRRQGMSGATDYERVHVTMSDWHWLKKPAPANPEKIEEGRELREGEETLFLRLLNEHRKDIVVLLTESGLFTPEPGKGKNPSSGETEAV